MKVSHKWLQHYFDQEIPTPEALADLFTFHSFEIEEVQKINGDTIIDAKILPDRAHYALSHKGIAEEVSVLIGLKLKESLITKKEISAVRDISVKVEDKTFCPRYTARVIENITVDDSDDVTKNRLEAVGSRSINSVVDATNYVMFDLGQPLHAFDADKVKGSIVVRYAAEGEKIVLLDGKEVVLTKSDSVIADEIGPLAIAGVKGGKRAEVTSSTKNIIVESANFNFTAIRKTSVRTGIRNESSKRYENAITPDMTLDAIEKVTEYILKSSMHAKVGEIIDIYPQPVVRHSINLQPNSVRDSLGISISDEEIVSILKRMHIEVVERGSELILTIPYRRLDLVLPIDIVEEVGRIYGYDKVPDVLFEKRTGDVKINKNFFYTEKIKTFLADHGFSEVYLYSLTNKGDFEVVYPLASDKSFLRKNLTQGIVKSLEMNAQNAPLLGLNKIKVFEIGTVFTKEGEYTSLAIGSKHIKKEKGLKESDEVKLTLTALFEELNLDQKNVVFEESAPGVVELHLTKYLAHLPDPSKSTLHFEPLKDITYSPVSVYPFMLRDIAVFVPEDTDPVDVLDVITDNSGQLLVRYDLFDIFTKQFPDGSVKKSYAYHLVFQSRDRTLTDAEVNAIMEKVTKEMSARQWQVR